VSPQEALRHPQLLAIRDELEAASQRARLLCDGLDEEALAWRPAPASWSIAECLRHLEVTTEVFLPGVDAAIERARRKGQLADGRFELGLWGRLLLWYVEPPPPLRLPAPKPLRPVLAGPPGQALSAFLLSQTRFAAALGRLEGIDLARATYVSPIARYIRMSVLAFLRVHTAHERRHLWQVERILQAHDAALRQPPAARGAML